MAGSGNDTLTLENAAAFAAFLYGTGACPRLQGARDMCQAHSAGGGGVSTAVPGVRRRYPADRVHLRAGPDPAAHEPPVSREKG